MSIIKFGAMVVGARGTAGGLIFSANKSGPYVRAWSKGANPQTSLQQSQRATLGDLAGRWRDLTVAEQDDWIDYADDAAQELTNSLGETYFISGFNWYVRINLHLLQAAGGVRDDAPTNTRPALPIIGSGGTNFYTTAGALVTRIIMDAGSPGLAEQHFVTAIVTGQGRTVYPDNQTYMINEVPNGARRLLFQDEIESSFGDIILGQRMFASVQVQDDQGQRSAPATIFKDAQTA